MLFEHDLLGKPRTLFRIMLQRKTPRLRTGLSWPTALGFQRLATNHAP